MGYIRAFSTGIAKTLRRRVRQRAACRQCVTRAQRASEEGAHGGT